MADSPEKTTKGSTMDNIFPVVEVEGICLPGIFTTNRPLDEHIRCLKSLEMRDDDVVLMACSKAGTHWLWEITTMLLSGKAHYEKRAKEHMMIEAKSIEDLQAEPSPRVLNSHLPFRLLPREVLEKKVKVIHVYRNVKDVFVSMYFHYRQVPGAEELTFDEFEEAFFKESLPTGNYFSYLRHIDDFVRKNPDYPIFMTSFEDMKEDTAKEVQRLAGFLGVEASPQLCQDIAQATSFAKLKSADQNKAQSHLPPLNYYRKGEVGDWKNHLTVARSERLDAAIEKLTSCNFRFRYTL